MEGEWGIACRGLSHHYGDRRVLEEVGLRVRTGSLVVLAGSNGAGKTTLMRILAGLLVPSKGTARIQGRDMAGAPMAGRRSLGYAGADERSFHGRLTVLQNLEFFGALHGVPGAELRARSGKLLETLGLGGHGRTRFGELSSGMKQAMSLVRSLLHDPPVLLLDEPTRSLSPDRSALVWDLVRGLARQGKTILLASHNLGEAEAVADEFAILHEGRLVAQGDPARLGQEQGLPGAPGALALFRHFTREAP